VPLRSNLLLTAARVLTPAAAFLKVEGEKNERITVEGGDISRASTPVEFSHGAQANTVKVRD